MRAGWFNYLKSGLSQRAAEDRLARQNQPVRFRSGLGNLRPFVGRHWRSGLVGAALVVLTSLLAFPQPLIMRYLVDDVILGRQLHRLVVARFLVVVFAAAERIARFVEEFYFARFEQEVILDIQEDLIARALRLPKAFFDQYQTGYLTARLSSDVQGLRWFFSSPVVHLISNLLRFSGGLGLLFYLEWRLALVVLLILPGLVLYIHYLSTRVHALSHRAMEEQALRGWFGRLKQNGCGKATWNTDQKHRAISRQQYVACQQPASAFHTEIPKGYRLDRFCGRGEGNDRTGSKFAGETNSLTIIGREG